MGKTQHMQQDKLIRLAERVLERQCATNTATQCNSSTGVAPQFGMHVWRCLVRQHGGSITAILPTDDQFVAVSLLWRQFGKLPSDIDLKLGRTCKGS